MRPEERSGGAARPVPAPPPAAPESEGGADAAERIVAGVNARMASLDTLSTAEHVAVFDEVHRQLSGVLGGLDGEREETAARAPGGNRESGGGNRRGRS